MSRIGQFRPTIVTATRRGRPSTRSHRTHVREDWIIANSVHLLLCWGFPRKKAFDAVAERTYDFFGASRKEIKPAGVKRIYDLWVKRQRNPWFQKYGLADHLPMQPSSFVFRPGKYTQDSLRLLRPHGTLQDLTQKLIDNKGIWPSFGDDLNRHFSHLQPRSDPEARY